MFCTDRTPEDVHQGRKKGCYGYEDLNRVEGAVKTLCALARRLDIRLELTVKTDWGLPGEFSENTWPVKRQMERYLANIRAITDALGLQAELPDSMENLNYISANNLEIALKMAHHRICSVLHTYEYSGELFAGEENGI